jgi:hypothetical protein
MTYDRHLSQSPAIRGIQQLQTHRLQAEKGRPVGVIVIDHIEKTPSEN